MKKLAWLMGLVVAAALVGGCTTAVVKLPNGVRIVQPKDVTFHGLTYQTNPDGTGTLKIRDYTSSANVAAVQAQTALIEGVVATAVKTAVQATVPVPGVAASPAVPAVAVPKPAAAVPAAVKTPAPAPKPK